MMMPYYTSFHDWVKSLILQDGLDVPEPYLEKDWQDWANRAIKECDPLSGMPSPAYFKDWRDWAASVYEQYRGN